MKKDYEYDTFLNYKSFINEPRRNTIKYKKSHEKLEMRNEKQW